MTASRRAASPVDDAAALRSLLRTLEWTRLPARTAAFCPCCGRYQVQGHTNSCALQDALQQDADVSTEDSP